MPTENSATSTVALWFCDAKLAKLYVGRRRGQVFIETCKSSMTTGRRLLPWPVERPTRETVIEWNRAETVSRKRATMYDFPFAHSPATQKLLSKWRVVDRRRPPALRVATPETAIILASVSKDAPRLQPLYAVTQIFHPIFDTISPQRPFLGPPFCPKKCHDTVELENKLKVK
jgi:hypothetical protein